jgi:competence protein CoiA
MRFALIDNIKVEAMPKLIAQCPGCHQPVVSKCGAQRIHHWAHQSKKNCDSWWEPETAWHRNWKDKFPHEWQECVMRDEKTGELHIADIHTSSNITLEFQHSHIDPQEQLSREKFHKNLTWVVDGTRLKRDYKRFIKEKKNYFSKLKEGIFQVDWLEFCLPSAWINSKVPVVFDFLGTETIAQDLERNVLYCLFPGRLGRYAIVTEMSRTAFIRTLTSGEWIIRVRNFMTWMAETRKERQIQAAKEQEIQNSINSQIFYRDMLKRWRRRRF